MVATEDILMLVTLFCWVALTHILFTKLVKVFIKILPDSKNLMPLTSRLVIMGIAFNFAGVIIIIVLALGSYLFRNHMKHHIRYDDIDEWKEAVKTSSHIRVDDKLEFSAPDKYGIAIASLTTRTGAWVFLGAYSTIGIEGFNKDRGWYHA